VSKTVSTKDRICLGQNIFAYIRGLKMDSFRRKLHTQPADQIWNNVSPNEEIKFILNVTHPVHVTTGRVNDSIYAKRPKKSG